MSTPHPQGPGGRPLTRREIRELEAQQIARAQQQQAQQAPSAPSNYSAAQVRSSVPTGVGSAGGPQRISHQSAPRVPHAAATPPPAQHQPLTGGRTPSPAAGASYGTGSYGHSSPTSVPSALPQRGIVEPGNQPVQVSRRSMYSVPAGKPEIPSVVPPVQASAVRTLQESGKLSSLVDAQEFTQASGLAPIREPHEQRATRPAGQPQNISGFMRQAPPSSQLPRVEQDGQGGWRAVDPDAAQKKLEREQEQRALFPTLAQNAGLANTLRGAESNSPAFRPQASAPTATGSALPSRVEAAGERTAPFQPFSNFGQSFDEDQPTAAFTVRELREAEAQPVEEAPKAVAPQRSLGFEVPPVGESPSPAAEGGMPAWDAITNARSEQAPSFRPGQPEQRVSSLTEAPARSRDMDEEDDEDFELDHSYTWLHYIILVAVAFVLGMIIWKVGIDPGTEAPPANEGAFSVSQVVDPLTA